MLPWEESAENLLEAFRDETERKKQQIPYTQARYVKAAKLELDDRLAELESDIESIKERLRLHESALEDPIHKERMARLGQTAAYVCNNTNCWTFCLLANLPPIKVYCDHGTYGGIRAERRCLRCGSYLMYAKAQPGGSALEELAAEDHAWLTDLLNGFLRPPGAAPKWAKKRKAEPEQSFTPRELFEISVSKTTRTLTGLMTQRPGSYSISFSEQTNTFTWDPSYDQALEKWLDEVIIEAPNLERARVRAVNLSSGPASLRRLWSFSNREILDVVVESGARLLTTHTTYAMLGGLPGFLPGIPSYYAWSAENDDRVQQWLGETAVTAPSLKEARETLCQGGRGALPDFLVPIPTSSFGGAVRVTGAPSPAEGGKSRKRWWEFWR